MKEVLGWIRSITFAVVFALVLGIFVFQPFKVDGHSMDPTLQDEQRIYVSKLSHTFSYLPDYGDIVVIDSRVERDRTLMDDIMGHPLVSLITGQGDDHTMYVKRVIGRPGDVLEFKDNKVYRNGEALNEPYIKETMEYVADGKITVPADHVFVMGDNRNHSTDSRDIGFIPLDHVMGTMIENPLNM
ncbi:MULTISPECIES: signal peptidase I [Brevibacillus]|uniref:signal peptidase I n=1 Tax=Brevibacillus TaxID=55080 RepID=UPI000D1042C9|nr:MULTISPECIES: signal peptidase I [Brevibacillus]MED1946547.1 signal peptidase I [Brevibacillus formosus]MED1996805.1 signal peptidase I [Brevibacillus formosus]MED2084722.1 signal peptidase I [Brevibacillus formosus]PSK11811.1 signal peptidase I [Brevibacillus sp. NRRL NRS-603]